MNEEKIFQESDRELDLLIQSILEAETNDFFALAEILGQDPKQDLAGANLQKVDLSGGNLQGANLRKTNLSSANLRGTDLRKADLSYADLSGADLSEADLSGAILNHVSVENARFINTKGIYERIQLEFIENGAIFEDDLSNPSNPNVDNIPKQVDSNILAYQEFVSKSLSKHFGNYIALEDKKIVAENKNKQKLYESLKDSKDRNSNVFLHRVEDDENSPIIELSPLYYQLEFLISPKSMASDDKPQFNLFSAPQAIIEIYNPSDSSQSCQVKAIIDSGASMTCMPESAINRLGGLIYSNIKFRNADGNIMKINTYYVNIKINEYRFQDIEVIAIPKEYALIGRDILNQHKIILDGPNKKWSIE